MDVWPCSRAFYIVDATSSHAYIFPFVHLLKFCITLTFFRYEIDPFQFFRRMEGAIPTFVVVVVDCSRTIWTLDDLARFVAGADALPIVRFARTQHSIGYILLISFFSNKTQLFYITVYIAMEELEYLLILYCEMISVPWHSIVHCAF